MNTHIYIDRDKPIVSKVEEKLTDGSTVWNIVLNGREVPYPTEQKADAALEFIAAALRLSGVNVLVL